MNCYNKGTASKIRSKNERNQVMLSNAIKTQIAKLQGILVIVEKAEKAVAAISSGIEQFPDVQPKSPVVRAEKIMDVDTSDIHEWDPTSECAQSLDLATVETRGVKGIVNFENGTIKK